MPDTNMKLSSAASSAAHSTIHLDIGSGISGAAAGHPNSSLLLPASANATLHDRDGANAAADKRWIGSLVCLATALTSASLLLWLILIIAG
jgi:hypothetical protein